MDKFQISSFRPAFVELKMHMHASLYSVHMQSTQQLEPAAGQAGIQARLCKSMKGFSALYRESMLFHTIIDIHV